jgi:predicted metal-dependent hydrolase
VSVAASCPSIEAPPWNGDVFRTRLFDGLSLILPSGEAFVIEAVAQAAAQLPSDGAQADALREEAGRFVNEELAHQRAHRLYNERLAREGLPARALEQRIEEATRPLTHLDLPTRLAFAAAFEQLTALLSCEVLRGNAWLTQRPSLQGRLWRWHCAEEIGHRHVAPQMLRACGVGEARRIACFAAATCFLAIDVVRIVAALCRHDLGTRSVSRTRLAAQACRFACRAAPGMCRMALGWAANLLPSR